MVPAGLPVVLAATSFDPVPPDSIVVDGREVERGEIERGQMVRRKGTK